MRLVGRYPADPLVVPSIPRQHPMPIDASASGARLPPEPMEHRHGSSHTRQCASPRTAADVYISKIYIYMRPLSTRPTPHAPRPPRRPPHVWRTSGARLTPRLGRFAGGSAGTLSVQGLHAEKAKRNEIGGGVDASILAARTRPCIGRRARVQHVECGRAGGRADGRMDGRAFCPPPPTSFLRPLKKKGTRTEPVSTRSSAASDRAWFDARQTPRPTRSPFTSPPFVSACASASAIAAQHRVFDGFLQQTNWRGVGEG